MEKQIRITFLHHSTGNNIWRGGNTSIVNRALRKFKLSSKSEVEKWFTNYYSKNGTNYLSMELNFTRKEPYGWKNYPFDYYNIWVKNSGHEPYIEELTLEMLIKENELIIWKHCFPVGSMLESTRPNIDSEIKTLENYKLQYTALKTKMYEFPNTKFLLWTGVALVKAATDEVQAKRARAFHDWVINEWDETGDNIYICDFYKLETEGGI